MLVYLAGPITGTSYTNTTYWRGYVQNALVSSGITCLSPMRCKEYLAKEENICAEYNTVLSCGKGITVRDYWDTSRCDVILVNLLGSEKVSIGTVMEIAWAYAHRKPIVLVMRDENVHDHPMIKEAAGFILNTLEDAIDVIKALK